MKIFKIPIIRIALFFTIFFLLNDIFIFILKPYSKQREEMTKKYWASETVDLCFLGSSVVYHAFNPYKFAPLAPEDIFDLSTPSQSLKEAYDLLEMASAKHRIKTVCMGYTYDGLKQDSYDPKHIIDRVRENVNFLPLHKKIYAMLSFIIKKKTYSSTNSVTFICPWIFNHTSLYPSRIIKNVKSKITGNFEHRNVKYLGKAWSTNVQADYNKPARFSKDYSIGEFLDSSLAEMDKICRLCKEKNIDLVVFAAPYTVYDVLAWKDEYVEKMKQLKSFFAERNVDYYDFNFIKPEIFEAKEQYFRDFQHMNSAGADAFSPALANFLSLRAAGKDMEQYFYTPEEFFSSIDYISAVNFSVLNQDDVLKMSAEAYCGTSVVPEYQFLIKKSDESSFSVIKDFGNENEFSFKPKSGGTYTVRVNARKSGNNTEFDRYNEKTVVFK